jgi:hypothetical protein
MNDVKEGSIDLADQTIDLKDLDEAYTEDLDKSNQEKEQVGAGGGAMDGAGLPPGPGIGGLGGAPAGIPGGGL